MKEIIVAIRDQLLAMGKRRTASLSMQNDLRAYFTR
jgi:hypothetical protein